MAGRLGIDFGTSNTVVARWDEASGQALTVPIPDYGRPGGDDQVSVVPSLIHYTADGRQFLGDQVISRGLYHAAGTFRWMKRYIGTRSPATVSANGRELSHYTAGRDFLSTVLAFAAVETGAEGEEVVLTAPVESFEAYEDWLGEVADAAGAPRFRLIDEPSAAALGYGAHIQPGNVYVMFDFGGGTVQAAVVLVQDEGAGSGRACRVLGKAGDELGGSTIDQWIFEELLDRTGRREGDEDVRRISRALLVECERAKEELSFPGRELAQISAMDPTTGAVLGVDLVRSGPEPAGDRVVSFEDLLDRRELFHRIDRVVRRALRQAADRGYDEDDVAAVLMVGGSSLIPSVRRTVERIFGRDRVLSDRPLDAVARGAAAFAAGTAFYDHIQHDYAVRWFDRQTGRYEYRTCVPAGTPYPSTEPVHSMTVKATYDGQTELGIAVYELGQRRRGGNGETELVCDPSGAWRVRPVSAQDREDRSRFWLNEGSPTFLLAEPPATAGQARFRVEFGIDGNKRLLLTAHDLTTNRVTHQDYPVVKLT
ncbi:MAG TPA: Hsp70 family protein [Mycobacteriales bacterium]|nr:Hsp70 family protein [Mycobacteriales bacterium]